MHLPVETGTVCAFPGLLNKESTVFDKVFEGRVCLESLKENASMPEPNFNTVQRCRAGSHPPPILPVKWQPASGREELRLH